jgi:hypothetical protein
MALLVENQSREVLYSQVDLEYNKSVLQNFAENSGYFNTRTSADSTDMVKKNRRIYRKTGKQYKIKEVKFHRFLYTQLWFAIPEEEVC